MMQPHDRVRVFNGLILITVTTWLLIADVAVSSPQTKLLNKGCSQYNATNLPQFYANQNATFADMRSQLNVAGRHFATASQAKSGIPVYAMAQCRNYLSTADCVACYDVAVTQIRNFTGANGARVIYDGCFLRYESAAFYDSTTLPGKEGLCGNRNASDGSAFRTAALRLLMDLLTATPKIKGFFAASKQQVSGGTAAVYGVAQCAETVSESGCQDCLAVAHTNLKSCPPSAEGRAIDAGCFLRYSNTAFFPDNQTTNLAPFLATGGLSKKKAIIGAVVGGVGFLLILLIIGLFVWYRRSRKPKAAPRGDLLGATELRGPVSYSYKDLKTATKGFSVENKLGEGGFGDVYKGTLKNGKLVAVKKLAIGQSQRAKADFESEVKLISNVHHRYIIRLLGCCSKGPELLLVYEYMANSSLDRFLFGEKRGSLNWKQRLDIIVGTARGLAYLHEEFHVCIIHRDIKTSNILLDDSLQPKIADFGLARLLPGDQSHLSTNFAGTLGYTAPEYAIHGQLSEKVDTYSYGVVVLEIISGHKSNELKAGHEFLLEQAWKLYENGGHLELVDDTIDPNEYEAEDVKKLIGIALMCIQSQPFIRPSMTEVVVMLKSKNSLEHMTLSKPTFVEHRPRADTSTSTGSSTSNAATSFSQISGR